MPGTLICYGDSNTYGYDPHDTNEGRYPKEVRWTGILDTETDWKVENHGVNGRSIPHTVSTVKFACQQVRDWHRKPNSVWLLVMLGTNDLLENPDFTAADVAKRMERFLKRMMEEAGLASRKMRLRLIAPPAMQEGQWVDRPELLTESRNLGKEYKRDKDKGLDIQVPKNYFPNDDDMERPSLMWRAHANTLYTNWLNYYVYQLTPYIWEDDKE